MLLDEIREGFANLADGAIAEIHSLPRDYPGWVYRKGDAYGVAVDLDERIEVSDRFAGARVYATTEHFGGGTHHQLRLESRREGLRNEFAVVCAQFLEPGIAGKARKALAARPHDWWEQWRQLLGDAIRMQAPYSVLGELLAYERLLQLGQQPTWLGPNSGSHDLETPAESYEVKSTISKYESVIHISGQFQLVSSGSKPLYLVHQRFEPSTSGESVDTVVQRLVVAGVPSDTVEDLLERVGLEKGTRARRLTFRLLTSRKYPVDCAFPRLTPDSFKGGTLPQGILAVEYKVDLATLKSSEFN